MKKAAKDFFEGLALIVRFFLIYFRLISQVSL